MFGKPLVPLLFLLLFSVNDIYACSCLESSIKQGFTHADIIFTGKAIAFDKITHTDSISNPEKAGAYYHRQFVYYEFTFEIKEIIKGNIDTGLLTITTHVDSASCGFYFELDTDYLVYSHRSNIQMGSWIEEDIVDPYYTTGLCTRTQAISKDTKKEIKKLKRLAKREG